MCHGIPGERVLADGDIINIDITTILDGFHGDTSEMFLVGNVDFVVAPAENLSEAIVKRTRKLRSKWRERGVKAFAVYLETFGPLTNSRNVSDLVYAGSSIMARTSSWARNSPRGQLLASPFWSSCIHCMVL